MRPRNDDRSARVHRRPADWPRPGHACTSAARTPSASARAAYNHIRRRAPTSRGDSFEFTLSLSRARTRVLALGLSSYVLFDLGCVQSWASHSTATRLPRRPTKLDMLRPCRATINILQTQSTVCAMKLLQPVIDNKRVRRRICLSTLLRQTNAHTRRNHPPTHSHTHSSQCKHVQPSVVSRRCSASHRNSLLLNYNFRISAGDSMTYARANGNKKCAFRHCAI